MKDFLTSEPYVGVVKLVSGETIIATVECLEDFTYRLSDPLVMNTAPVMTNVGIQMAQVAVPWMQNSSDQSFLVSESNVVTIGEVQPAVFENYINIINSDIYNQHFSPINISYDTPVEHSLTNPILDKFRNNLENCFKL